MGAQSDHEKSELTRILRTRFEMPRPPGSKNKKTIEREAAERSRQESLLPAEPFSETAARATAFAAEPTPLPSVRSPAEQNFIEYVAPNGSRWRIENGK